MTYGSFLGLTVRKITYRLKRDNADKTNSLFPLTKHTYYDHTKANDLLHKMKKKYKHFMLQILFYLYDYQHTHKRHRIKTHKKSFLSDKERRHK